VHYKVSFWYQILIIGSVLHSVPKDEQPGSDSSRTSIVSTLGMLQKLACCMLIWTIARNSLWIIILKNLSNWQIICGVILSPLALALAVLLGWHIYLILQNKTTIEVCDLRFFSLYRTVLLFIEVLTRLLLMACSTMKEFEQCGWQKKVEISIIIHMTLVSMRILFQ